MMIQKLLAIASSGFFGIDGEEWMGRKTSFHSLPSHVTCKRSLAGAAVRGWHDISHCKSS